MHCIKLRNIRMEDGRVRHVLLSQDYDGVLVPDYFANLFILSKYNSRPANTIKQVLLAIRCLLAWAARENIDIVERMRSFRFLQDQELNSLKDALMLLYERLTYEASRAIAKRDPDISISNVIEMPIQGVASNTANIRLFYVAEYLHWLAKDKLIRLTKGEREEIEPELERQSRWFQDNFLTAAEPLHGKPLTKKQKEILEGVLRPNSTIPIWNETVRSRNCLIVSTLHETGARKRELMCFKLNDAQGDRTITLRNIPNDPEDPRMDKGEVKTCARTLNISASLDQRIQDYIIEHRSPGHKRVRHKFIFTSINGRPISVSAIDNIFKQLRKVEGLENICPHDLRYDLATDLRRRLSEEGKSDEVAEDYMRGVFGWGPKSKMPAHYTRQLAAETLRKMSEEQQERLDK